MPKCLPGPFSVRPKVLDLKGYFPYNSAKFRKDEYVPEDIVTRLEKKIDELLTRQQNLAEENRQLRRECDLFENDRKRCRDEIDSILAKLDRLG